MMNKVGRKMKILVFILLILILTPILLNFIPIKFAIELNEAQKNLKVGRYICITDYKQKVDNYTEWLARTDFNSHLERTLAVRVSGRSPNNYLSEKEFESFDSENRFLLIGKVERFEEDKDGYFLNANLNVDKWKIVYPIK